MKSDKLSVASVSAFREKFKDVDGNRAFGSGEFLDDSRLKRRPTNFAEVQRFIRSHRRRGRMEIGNSFRFGNMTI